MNVELKSTRSEKNDLRAGVETKEAKKHREQGDRALGTSCLLCKFRPNCEEAIPSYNLAVEAYHAAGQWNEEIYCRDKLIYCHRTLKSSWEEGNENEKKAYVYFNGLEKNDLAFNCINNSYQCFFIHGDYKDAVNSVKKLAQQFYQKDEIDFAERCLKISYDAFLQVFHTLATKKDEPYEFLYDALDAYLAILFRNNKVRIAIEACENVLKVIDQYEENKSQIVHVLGFLLLCLIVNEDENGFAAKSELTKSACAKNSDYRFIENIINLKESIREGRENQFRENMIEINVDYPNEVGKKLLELFNSHKRVIVANNGRKEPFITENDEDMIVIVRDDKGDEIRDDYL